MKILVFDDNQLHRKGAENQLGKDHNLVLVDTYDKAEECLKPMFWEEKLDDLMEKKGYKGFNPYDETVSQEQKLKYFDDKEEATKQATVYPEFDMVLTDLLVPASDNNLGMKGEKYIGEDMPLGMMIAFLAMKNGIKKIAVLTDTNHHNHPASAALDALGGGRGEVFMIGDVKMLFANSLLYWPVCEETIRKLSDEEKESLGYDKYQHYPSVKAWDKAVKALSDVELKNAVIQVKGQSM